MFPRIRSYAPDFNVHALWLTINEVEIYYSYNDIIAFLTPETGLIISENLWGTTTGRHINYLSRDKASRYRRSEFELLLTQSLIKHSII